MSALAARLLPALEALVAYVRRRVPREDGPLSGEPTASYGRFRVYRRGRWLYARHPDYPDEAVRAASSTGIVRACDDWQAELDRAAAVSRGAVGGHQARSGPAPKDKRLEAAPPHDR